MKTVCPILIFVFIILNQKCLMKYENFFKSYMLYLLFHKVGSNKFALYLFLFFLSQMENKNKFWILRICLSKFQAKCN